MAGLLPQRGALCIAPAAWPNAPNPLDKVDRPRRADGRRQDRPSAGGWRSGSACPSSMPTRRSRRGRPQHRRDLRALRRGAFPRRRAAGDRAADRRAAQGDRDRRRRLHGRRDAGADPRALHRDLARRRGRDCSPSGSAGATTGRCSRARIRAVVLAALAEAPQPDLRRGASQGPQRQRPAGRRRSSGSSTALGPAGQPAASPAPRSASGLSGENIRSLSAWRSPDAAWLSSRSRSRAPIFVLDPRRSPPRRRRTGSAPRGPSPPPIRTLRASYIRGRAPASSIRWRRSKARTKTAACGKASWTARACAASARSPSMQNRISLGLGGAGLAEQVEPGAVAIIDLRAEARRRRRSCSMSVSIRVTGMPLAISICATVWPKRP